MISERARIITASYVVADLATTSIALYAAHFIRGRLGDQGWLGPVYPFDRYLPLLLLILPLWTLVFQATGLYGRKAAQTLRPEISRLVKALTVCGLLLAAVIVAGKLDYVSRPLLALFMLLDGMLIVAARTLVRTIALDSTTRRYVIVAGDRAGVVHTTTALDQHRDWGLEVIGVVGDGSWTPSSSFAHPLLGVYADLPELVRKRVVDEVLIVPAPGQLERFAELEQILDPLREQGVVTRLLVNFLPPSLTEVSLEHFGGLPLLTFAPHAHSEVLLLVRRVADILLAALLLFVLSPLFLVLAALVKATSKGPVLFRQTRCGLNGRPFTFLKFRSMRVDAEELKPLLAAYNEMDGPAFKMTDDPRVTPLGKWLRRTSLDELPQLWNIFVGDMSFVGPRPAVVEEVRQYQPWQRRRLSMKPGLTCLWQISGRNEIPFDEWMRLDLEYIDNWSLWLDLKIAMKTIPAVLLGRGAR
jgi:exopolysaccharide biosynthesis polyprenyl glycosylphosphotransferase